MNEAILKLPKEQEAPSAREQEVLATVLDLMVEEGDGFSMASVAKRASCSKETLYRWFGDRDGLLTATVQWQASKVVTPRVDPENLDYRSFSEVLRAFASSWLGVITGEVSIALNRMAVSHAGNGKTSLGDIVLKNGPLRMKTRLRPIFEAGQEAGFVSGDVEAMFRVFFGLVVADTQIRVMLGDNPTPNPSEINVLANEAVERFLSLYGSRHQQNI